MSEETTSADQHTEPAAQPQEKGPSRWQRLRSRASTVGKGTLVALLAGLLLGAGAGFAVGAVTLGDGPDRDDRGGVHGHPFGDEGDRGPGVPPGTAPGGAPGELPGEVPPTTAPEGETSSDLNG